MNGRLRLGPILLVLAIAAGCDRQESEWEDAQTADNVSSYQEFLERYPDSARAGEAEQRIRALRAKERWEQARDTGSVEAHQQFLRDFPEAEQAEQARSRLTQLERDRDWENLRDSNDVQAIRAFGERHRGDPVAEEARQRIQQLETEAREAEARDQARLEAERRAAEAERGHRVQLAAFRSEERANEGAEILERRLAEILAQTQIEVTQSGSYHLLRTQPLSEDDARSMCRRLQESDQECLVVDR